MALELQFPTTHVPAHLKGTIDGIVPVQFIDHGDSWELQIGDTWRHRTPHDLPAHERRPGAIRTAIYGAVARYRNFLRGLERPLMA